MHRLYDALWAESRLRPVADGTGGTGTTAHGATPGVLMLSTSGCAAISGPATACCVSDGWSDVVKDEASAPPPKTARWAAAAALRLQPVARLAVVVSAKVGEILELVRKEPAALHQPRARG